MTSSTSASTVNTHGVHAAPMKASQVPLTSRRPRRAAQLAAAGAVNVRDPATTPMSSAKKYAVTSHPVYEARGPSIAEAPHHHLPRIRRGTKWIFRAEFLTKAVLRAIIRIVAWDLVAEVVRMLTTKRRSQFGSHALVRVRWLAMLLLVLAAGPIVARAQWLNYPTPGIPRLANGAPDLKAPAPRTRDGKPDFSGMWFANVPSRDYCKEKDCIQEERMAREQINLGIKLKDGLPYTEWSKEQMKIRRANGGREDPHSYCMPPNFPRAWTLPQHTRIVQTPGMMVVLHEFNGAYREVYLDGRPLPVNPNPTWNGYSTGHWEGDTLVIETNGIRDDMWLDIQGSPITESARVTERLKRLNLGLMQIEIGVNDPKAYTRPWSVTIEMALIVDTQMLEEICLDNEKDTKLYKK